MGQERFLQGAEFSHKAYRAWREDWDHDHCAFCAAKFVEDTSTASADPDAQTAGYAALGRGPEGQDDYHWVCDECFEDFRGRFDWTVAGSDE